MKLLKTLSLGFVAAASLIGSAHATTTEIYLTGSTAFRGIVGAEEIAYLSSGITYGCVTSGKNVYNDANTLIQGTDSNGNTVIFNNFWSGSLAGVVDLGVGNKTITWLTTTGVTSTNPLSPSVVTANVTGIAPDVAMTDAYFGTIATEVGSASSTGSISAPGQVGTGAAALSAALSNLAYTDAGATDTTGSAFGSAAASAGTVGVVTFEPLIGNIASHTAEFSGGNLSTLSANELIGGGFVSETQLTGNTANKGNFVYWVGRNEDSGTRIAYLAESGVSVIGSPNQYAVISATSAKQYPITALTTEPTITWGATGHSGYVSGGNVATALSLDESSMTRSIFPGGTVTAGSSNSGAVYFASIMGINDLQTVSHGQILTWNGVPFSTTNIANGTYSLWENEHMYYLGSLDSGVKQTIADKLAGLIYHNGPSVTVPTIVFAGCDVDNTTLLYVKSNFEGSTLTANY
jgi:hypothetical protein